MTFSRTLFASEQVHTVDYSIITIEHAMIRIVEKDADGVSGPDPKNTARGAS